MSIINVFDVKRKNRKVFKINTITLDEVKRVVRIKFGFECHKLVLEQNGAEIEEDEVFEELITSTFVALRPGEEWNVAITGDTRSSKITHASTVQQNESTSTSEDPCVVVEQQNESTPTSEATSVAAERQNDSIPISEATGVVAEQHNGSTSIFLSQNSKKKVHQHQKQPVLPQNSKMKEHQHQEQSELLQNRQMKVQQHQKQPVFPQNSKKKVHQQQNQPVLSRNSKMKVHQHQKQLLLPQNSKPIANLSDTPKNSTYQQLERQILCRAQTPVATKANADQQNENQSLCSSHTTDETNVTENPQIETDDSNDTLTTEVAKLKELIKKEGLHNILPHINEHLEAWKKEPVRFAITGSSGTGKSTFINAIRNVKPGELGFAKVSSSGNTTIKKARYSFPENDKITIDDLPGYGTTDFPKNEYEMRMQILNYDYILIFVSNIDENDIEFGKLLQKKKLKFAFIRSKLDIDLQNCTLDGETTEEANTKIKSKSVTNLAKANLKEVPWFGISSSKRHIGQFDCLVAHIQSGLSDLKGESVMYTLLGELSSDFIKRKFDQLKKRIEDRLFASVSIATIGAPPGVDIAVNGVLLVMEIELYKKTFGFDQNFVKERAALPEVRQRLHKNSLLFNTSKWEEILVFAIAELAAIGAFMKGANDSPWPKIGSFLSSTVAGTVFDIFLNIILKRCRDDAFVVYSHLLENPTEDTNLSTIEPAEPEPLVGGSPHTEENCHGNDENQHLQASS